MQNWGVSDSLKKYSIENWGNQYFSINPSGNMTVHPKKGAGAGIDLLTLIKDIQKRGLDMPVLFRFQDVIRHRVVELNETFAKVISEAEYGGRYQGVYPIKVNQMREVVEEILDAGERYDFGLEAGSKAELAAVVAMETSPNALTICNGYKDDDFIQLALYGRKLGKRVIIVVEKLSELHSIIKASKELGVKPLIGIRTKLYSRGSGKWESSGGETAKFGLTTPELIHALDIIKKEDLVDSFKLLHFHIGSQVSSIRPIKDACREMTRIYAKLSKMDFNVEFIDVGGGLGVDYDGSQTDFDSSTNYSLKEYVENIVYTIQEICSEEKVPEPNIVSESGRALVAHHSVLAVNALGSLQVGASPVEMEQTENEPDVVAETRELLENITHKNLLDKYHDAVERKEQAQSMFDLGILSLEDRAKVEDLFWRVAKRVHKLARELKYIPDELEDLKKYLADQYLCNFSVFQSLMDYWAIEQLFPIAPLHRLDEAPSKESILVDITCDSDGKINRFIDLRDIKQTLPVHPLQEGKPYYLGIFLMGAYQDIMGDLHNLFGRVNEVHVFLDETEPGGYYIEEVIKGNTVAELLSWIQYGSSYLQRGLKSQIDQQVREGALKPKEGVDLQSFYQDVLRGYTYMSNDTDSERKQNRPLRPSPRPDHEAFV